MWKTLQREDKSGIYLANIVTRICKGVKKYISKVDVFFIDFQKTYNKFPHLMAAFKNPVQV